MAKNKKRILVLDRFFQQPFEALFGYTEEDLRRHIGKTYNVDLEPDRVGRIAWDGISFRIENPDDASINVLALQPHLSPLELEATLVHELTHLVVQLWASNRMEIGVSTQEFAAEMLGSLYHDIMGEYRKKSKPKKRVTNGSQ